MKFHDIRGLLLLPGILLLCACGSSSGGADDDEVSETYGDYISIDSPSSVANGDYSTKEASVTPGGYAEIPASMNCKDAIGPSTEAPPGYRITVTNTANGNVSEAYAALICNLVPRMSWTVTYFNPVPLEMGDNKIIARVTYPAEGISGQASQTIKRTASRSPGLQTYPLPDATDVATDIIISVKLDGQLNQDDITAESFVVRDQNGVSVGGNVTVEYNAEKDYSTLGFIPDYKLAPSALHQATIAPGIGTAQGVELPDGYSWRFTTAAPP